MSYQDSKDSNNFYERFLRRRLEETREKRVLISQGGLLSLPFDLLEIMPIYGHSLFILNSLIRLNKKCRDYFLRNNNLVRVYEAFERYYLNEKTLLIQKDLQNRIKVYPTLTKIIEENNAIISGSYTLKFLSGLESKFEHSDIDIFIPYYETLEERNNWNDHTTLLEARNSREWFMDTYIDPIIDDDDIIESIAYTSAFTYGRCKRMRFIIDVELCSHEKLQFIFLGVLWEETIVDAIDDTFDFSFNKCWFDGQSMGTMCLYEQIRRVGTRSYTFKKEDSFSSREDMDDYIEKVKHYNAKVIARREKKYVNRGFLFLDH